MHRWKNQLSLPRWDLAKKLSSIEQHGGEGSGLQVHELDDSDVLLWESLVHRVSPNDGSGLLVFSAGTSYLHV